MIEYYVISNRQLHTFEQISHLPFSFTKIVTVGDLAFLDEDRLRPRVYLIHLDSKDSSDFARFVIAVRRIVGPSAPIFCVADFQSDEAIAGIIQAGCNRVVETSISGRLLDALSRAAIRRLDIQYFSDLTRYRTIVLNRSAHKVWIGPEQIHLTLCQFSILHLLCRSEGGIVATEMLTDGADFSLPTGIASLSVHISHLRAVLRSHGYNIRSRRSLGYQLVEERLQENNLTADRSA